MIKYIDISEHQGSIDFAALKGSVDGVIVRAGYGRGNVDKQFARNAAECNRLGIPLGAYWFSYAYTEAMAEKEAEYFISYIRQYKIDLPVAWDWEYDSLNYAKRNGVTPTRELVSAMAKAFLNRMEAAGYYAMNYTNPSLGKQYFSDEIFKRYDLWLAQWPNIWTEQSKPQMSCGIWQWGGSTVPGISGSVDTNVAYKDYYSLLRKAEDREEPKKWYDEAVAWAKEACVMDGTRPEEPATRAEVAQMLYNYDKQFSGLLTDD